MTAPKGQLRVKCQGPGCGRSFYTKSSRAKFCSPTCRSRSRRKSPVEAEDELARAVRSDLRKAGKLGSYHGQMALKLAAQLAGAGPTGAAGLSKELDRLMGLALGLSSKPGPAEPVAPVEPVEDEVTLARKARETARQAAGFG